ncbi:DUF7504 family protein [Sphingomonas sp. DT-204]|uniref:DUF7504 family protein n=1 Tax=Sphingomonas sp. DT-204 TaxID=3396166 RepID=UPI003F1A49C3
MTIVKATAAAEIRRIAAPVEGYALPLAEPSPAERRIAELTTELAQARGELIACRQEAKVQAAAARIDGAREAKRDDEARIAALEKRLAEAICEWRDRLQELEALALLLAKSSLAKLFDEYADLADLVARTLTKRVREIDAQAAMRVHVSAEDFPDPDSLHALADRCGVPLAALVADDLETGGCRIDLVLGHLDLSLPAQWSVIRQRLEAIAEDAGA